MPLTIERGFTLNANAMIYDGKGNYPPSGYGLKIKSSYQIPYNGRLRRVYHTCVSNAPSAWIASEGKQIFIR